MDKQTRIPKKIAGNLLNNPQKQMFNDKRVRKNEKSISWTSLNDELSSVNQLPIKNTCHIHQLLYIVAFPQNNRKNVTDSRVMDDIL